MKKIAIFASGSGSNAENIVTFFKGSEVAEVGLIMTNSPKAYVLERAQRLGVPAVVFTREDFYQADTVVEVLKKHHIDFVVLAGFLWLVPNNLIQAFPDKIVNIHPALLPKYGGKGMYGDRVHAAVKEAGEKETGITVHMVNANYDEGQVVFQGKCPIEAADTSDMIAEKVHALEYAHYPAVIAKVIKDLS